MTTIKEKNSELLNDFVKYVFKYCNDIWTLDNLWEIDLKNDKFEDGRRNRRYDDILDELERVGKINYDKGCMQLSYDVLIVTDENDYHITLYLWLDLMNYKLVFEIMDVINNK